ncbi:hypothetical protein DLJ53_33485 [Acuticoccus sediminis]|uniref:Uncharacterized protein n=1 Tax=Acuticoccus sediminis TaxID=2184697 RepID=A0A8B2NNJ1_9HYPH|nr:hypothetical protein [Acuticoccus sediminis]RAH96063.1 hypothetical protein DLJ53_33485 [Acuticoccus sediminis]
MSRDVLILTPPQRQPYAPEILYSASEDDFAAGRDVLILSPRDEDPELTKQRAELEAEILRQRGEVSAEIDRLLADNHEGELDEQIARLGAALRLLDADLAAARYGSASTVAAMTVSMPAQADSLRQIADPAEARFQSGSLMAEVTLSALEHLSIFDMAERFTPEHFAQMSTAQLDAIRRRSDALLESGLHRAPQADRAVETALGEAGIDSDFFRQNRDRFAADAEEARRSGDRLDLARALILGGTNRAEAFRQAGRDDLAEAEEALRDEQIANARLIAREEAAREARLLGKTGKAAAEHIARREEERMTPILEQDQALRESYQAQGPETVGLHNQQQEELRRDDIEEAADQTQFAVAGDFTGFDIAAFGSAAPEQAKSTQAAINLAIEQAAQQFAASGQPTGGAKPDGEQPEAGEDVSPKTVAATAPEKPTRTV